MTTLLVAISTLAISKAENNFDLGAPTHLRVENLFPEVAVLSERKPRFSFVPPAAPVGAFNTLQASYRITVSNGKTSVWDSGNVASDATSQIEYAGAALSPFTRYQWTAEVTTVGGHKSAAATSTFETGPLGATDWHNATWLSGGGGTAQFRFEFDIGAGSVAWARAYVAAPGCAAVEVNGQSPKINLRGICPWVVGGKMAHANTRYQTHDITAAIVSGKRNAIGVLTGNVMTSTSEFVAVVMVQLNGQAPSFFTTGTPGWQQRASSYITKASAWETDIDWTQQEEGWSSPGFSPKTPWNSVTGSASDLPLRSLSMPVSAVLEEVEPVLVQALAGGDFLYTFPKNFVGTVRVKALPNADDSSSLSILAGEWLTATGPAPPAPPPGPPAPCGEVAENQILKLGGCKKGDVIASVTFASFGTPSGSCQKGFKIDASCHAHDSLAYVQSQCVNKSSCAVHASSGAFGGDPCNGTRKKLAVQIKCSGGEVDRDAARNAVVATEHVTPLPPLPPPGTGTFPAISGGKQQFEKHVLRNGNAADIETLFCWHGFQYVRVSPSGHTGFRGGLGDVVGLAINTNMTATGSLRFGGDGVAGSEAERAAAVLNGINSMTLQSQRTNVAAYMPTDCPTREKHGWMGDALDASEQAMYNFDMVPVHTAFLQTVKDNQGPGGDVPFVVPGGTPGAGACNDIAWTSAYPQISSMLGRYYGDERLAARHWDSLVMYQENLIANARKNPQGIAECDRFKDWLCGNAQSCCSHTPSGSACPVGPEMGGFNYVLGLRAMAEMAASLGNSSASTRYTSLAQAATTSFHKAFYNPKFGQYGGDSGAVQSLSTPALFIHSPPQNLFPSVLQTLEDDLSQDTDYTLRVGAVTSKILLNILSDNGHHATALRTATSTTEPSWGYWWSQNSSTCWESWPSGHGTRNHIFLCGGVGEWMWKHLVGLTPQVPQFAQVAIAPQVHPNLGPASASGRFWSPRGIISSAWNVTESGAQVQLAVSLPMGVRGATLVVPKPFTTVPSPPSTLCESKSEREGGLLALSCPPGGEISSIDFAAFGTPSVSGPCASWKANATCNDDPALVHNIVAKACVGKPACSVDFGHAGKSPFGDPCDMVVKTLAVKAQCSGGHSSKVAANAVVKEGGVEVWDGKGLVGSHPGLLKASDAGDGIAFVTTNGDFSFTSTPLKG